MYGYTYKNDKVYIFGKDATDRIFLYAVYRVYINLKVKSPFLSLVFEEVEEKHLEELNEVKTN